LKNQTLNRHFSQEDTQTASGHHWSSGDADPDTMSVVSVHTQRDGHRQKRQITSIKDKEKLDPNF
jgi:hypothetical protein